MGTLVRVTMMENVETRLQEIKRLNIRLQKNPLVIFSQNLPKSCTSEQKKTDLLQCQRMKPLDEKMESQEQKWRKLWYLLPPL